MNIKSKVKEVNDYFVDKILKEEFDLKKYEMCDETILLYITIDGFQFCIWNCCNKGSTYNGSGNCHINLSFTALQALKINTIIKRIKKERYQKGEDKKEREQYEKLKAKFM